MTSTDQTLTSQTTLGEWLEDPVGGPLILKMLSAQGQDASHLGAARVFPLDQLVVLSRGKVSQESVDDLVMAANGGRWLDAAGRNKAAGSAAPEPVRSGLRLQDIQIRDPFILNDPANTMYYLYGSTDKNIWFGPGTGFNTYRSRDLVTWEGPFEAFRPPTGFWSEGMYWAPEVHRYRDHWFMFATFTAPDGYRGTQILRAEQPEGPFTPWTEGPVTPRKWQCLDGTLHVDQHDNPWIVFCHEWTQIHDGAVYAQRLSDDLLTATGPPVFLFNASDAPWSKPMRGAHFDDYKFPVHVTDGPFLVRLNSGHLIMLWSSFGEQGYATGVAHSLSGDITGPWKQEAQALWPRNGGHGMVFQRNGELALTLHQPNETPHERAIIQPLTEQDSTVTLANFSFS